ncbi:MAG: hypothetical protein L6416_08745 [Candidatus Omnitrophica bacterium]|nr:hypothetical protein [Candidatus Omnitrophota bacterium]
MCGKEINIDCLKFQEQEQIMQGIIDRINQAKDVREKARFAQELHQEAEEILSCPLFDSKSLDCNNCNFIANLRKKTANLIIKVKQKEGSLWKSKK